MNLYEAIKNNANSRLIIKPVPSNDVWLKFKLGDVTGSAKVFIEGSDYGISGFDKISKLSYSSSSDECNYDRGWDVEPKDKELFNKICKGLEDYRAKHPYSLDESELNEAEDNSTEIIKGVIKSKNLPNGTKVSSITDDTFNSIVKDVQAKIPGSKENDVRNKVAGTLYSMFEESDDIEDDEYIDCEWCGDHVPLDECKKELNLGWICRGCQNALYSRGEHPVYDEQAVYGFDEAESYYVIPKDLQSIIDSYSTNVDDPMYDNGYEVPDELLKLSVEPPKNMRIRDWMRINCPFEYQLDRIPEDWTFDTIHSQPGLFKDLAYEIDSDPREQIYNKLTDLYGDDFTSSLYDSEGFKESDAKILDFEETGGGCLNYVGEVGDYNFVGELNGDLMFIPKSCGINSWEAYQDLHEDHFSDWESHDELIPEVVTALDKYAKTIKNPRYRVAVYDDVSRLRYPDESLDEAEGSEDSTEKYWDATTLKQDAFLRLMKFNFDEPHGCQYIITNDANEVERFRADSDEEAIGYYDSFKEGLDSGLIELMPADLDVKPIVPREDINETELSDRKFCDLPDDFQKKVITYLLKQKRGNSKEIIEYLMNAKVGDFNDTSLLTQDEFVDLYDV